MAHAPARIVAATEPTLFLHQRFFDGSIGITVHINFLIETLGKLMDSVYRETVKKSHSLSRLWLSRNQGGLWGVSRGHDCTCSGLSYILSVALEETRMPWGGTGLGPALWTGTPCCHGRGPAPACSDAPSPSGTCFAFWLDWSDKGPWVVAVSCPSCPTGAECDTLASLQGHTSLPFPDMRSAPTVRIKSPSFRPRRSLETWLSRACLKRH